MSMKSPVDVCATAQKSSDNSLLMAAQFNESILKSNCSVPMFDSKSQSAPSAGRMPVPVTSGRGGVVDAVSTGAVGSLRKPATRPVLMKESATKSAMTRFVRFAELAPLAMATLGCCTQPVTDTCRAASCKTKSKGVSACGDGHDCSDYKADNGNSDMNGVLGICHVYRVVLSCLSPWPRVGIFCN